MYPTVMPQSELASKLEDTADVANKSWVLRETAERRQRSSSSSSSGSGSGSDSGTAVSCKRETATQRPRSSDRKPKAERRPISRSQSAQPQRSNRNSRMAQASLREEMADAQTLMDPEEASPDLFDSRSARRTRARSSAPVLEHPERRKRRGTASKDDFKTIETAATDTRKRPNAMSFLDLDSPDITEEDIRRVVETSGEWSPRSASSSSSSNDSAGQRSTADTDVTTPEHSINGDGPPPASEQEQTAPSDAEEKDRYGTPEMTRGPMKHPHIPPKELQPRIAAPGQGHAKHLPRAEKLPMSGYELLAAKLSSSEKTRSRRRGSVKSTLTDDGEAPIKPIYRRFEALNHRLLLHLQDELSELEEQLHRLDTTDTQTRRLANCILPASRRAEFMAGGELQWHKTDILGKIGFKLGHYNQVLTSFTETQALPSASLSDVETYRTYLATRNPIAEIETRFLDPTDDLVCLSPPNNPSRRSSSSSSSSTSSPALSEDMLTPMPLKTTFGFSPSPPDTGGTNTHTNSTSPSRKQSISSPLPLVNPTSDSTSTSTTQLTPTTHLALLGALAITAPILTFGFITDFVFRMAVVLVVGLVVSALRGRMDDSLRAGAGEAPQQATGEEAAVTSTRDVLVLVGIYGGVMGFLAAVV